MPDTSDSSRDEITHALTKWLRQSPAPIDEALWERRMRALFLRNAGGTFTQIAAETGVHPDTARADVQMALREVMAVGNEERMARQLSVLLDMQRGAYAGAMNGDKDSIMAIVRCLEQEAKLCGMYAPTKQTAGVGDVDFAQQAAGLIAKLGLVPPRELMAGLGAAAIGMDGMAASDAMVAEVSEIIDGVIERISVFGQPVGFDIVASPLLIEDEPEGLKVERAVSEEAVSRAAAEAITGGQASEQRDPWSNL